MIKINVKEKNKGELSLENRDVILLQDKKVEMLILVLLFALEINGMF